MGFKRKQQIFHAIGLILDLFHLIHDLHGGPFGHGNDVVQLVFGVLDLFPGLIEFHPFHAPVFHGNLPHGRAEAFCQLPDIIKYIGGNFFVVIVIQGLAGHPGKVKISSFRRGRGKGGNRRFFLGQDMPHHLGGPCFRTAKDGDVIHHRIRGYPEKTGTYLKINFRLSRCGHTQPPAAVRCLLPCLRHKGRTPSPSATCQFS